MPPVGPAPGDGPPADFDYHTVGIVFDLLRPADDRDRKLLEYALNQLEDLGAIAFAETREGGERRYHVAPNPHYAAAFESIVRRGGRPEDLQ